MTGFVGFLKKHAAVLCFSGAAVASLLLQSCGDATTTAGGEYRPSRPYDTTGFAADTLLVHQILDSNNITTINVYFSGVAGFDTNRRVEELDFSWAKVWTPISILPDQIGDLPYLKKLNVAGQKSLKALPASIGRLSNLTILKADQCGIRSIHSEVFNCVNLTRLYLDSDSLTALPFTIGRLSNLTMLELALNQLTDLPDSIVHCGAPTLKVNVMNNRLCALDSATAAWVDKYNLDDPGWRSNQTNCP